MTYIEAIWMVEAFPPSRSGTALERGKRPPQACSLITEYQGTRVEQFGFRIHPIFSRQSRDLS